MYSFIIPVKDNLAYTQFTYNRIRELYPTHEIVIVSKSTDGTNEYFQTLEDARLIFKTHDEKTLSGAYNLAVSLATQSKIVLMHNDMYLSDNFIESLDIDLQPNTILTYTRVEPPIFTDIYAGKEIMDFGNDIHNFDSISFNSYCTSRDADSIEGGSQLFFACYKDDYIGLDSATFEVFCEDDDIHLRYRLGGFDMKVSQRARVYHLVSKTSRKTNLSHIEQQSNINFIKKWGFRNGIQPRYKKQLILENGNSQLEGMLDPWFDEKGDIKVFIDGNNFTSVDYQVIQNLPSIIQSSNQTGTFNISNLKVEINQLTELQNTLIRC